MVGDYIFEEIAGFLTDIFIGIGIFFGVGLVLSSAIILYIVIRELKGEKKHGKRSKDQKGREDHPDGR